MNIADEGSGAHLQATVHTERYVASISKEAAIGDVNHCFERWGLPQNIKIDNGRPFVNGSCRDVPTIIHLWWIGLGVNVIQNTPRVPQENGIVECLQGTLYRWTNPSSQKDAAHLQKRLDEESEFQRKHYRLSTKGNQTRMELFPQLATNKTCYNPSLFSIEKVYDYLRNKVWQRKIKKSGEIKFWGTSFYIGQKYAYMPIDIMIDPLDKQWLFRAEDGRILKTSDKAVPREREIKAFALRGAN